MIHCAGLFPLRTALQDKAEWRNEGRPATQARSACDAKKTSKKTRMGMTQQTPAEHELAELIVSSLNLEHIKAGEFDPEKPLFGAESGLDSIDALELALAVSKRYGFQLRSDNAENKRIFSSLRNLSTHVEQNRVEQNRAEQNRA